MARSGLAVKIGSAFPLQARKGLQPSRFIVHMPARAGPTGAVAVSTATSSPLPPPDRHAVLRVVPMPADANVHGDVFGGWIMSQVDIAGSVPAARRAAGRVATVAVNAFTFRQPVFVGDLVSFYAEIIKVGRTSITVAVEVYAERQSLELQTVKVTEATLTYVATDAQRRSRPLPAA